MSVIDTDNKPNVPFLAATDLQLFESWVGLIKFKWTKFTIWLLNNIRYIKFRLLQLVAWTKLITPPIMPENIVSLKREKILYEVYLNIYAGEVIAIMGPSGAGKSTLLKLLSGQAKPYRRGKVVIKNLDSRIAEQAGRVIGYLHQDDILHTELSLQDALFYSARLRHPEASTSDIKAYVDAVIEKTQISHRSRYSINTLSGGERRRANLSAELLSGSTFLFLDEPTANLDPYHSRELIKLIKENIVTNERAVILSTHDVWNFDLYDKIAFIFEGKMIFYGPPIKAIEFFEKNAVPEMGNQRKTENLADIYAMFESIKDDKKRFTLVEHYENKWRQESPFLTESQDVEKENNNFYKKKLWRTWRISITAQLRQFFTLSKRFSTCYLTDMLLLLLIQPIIASVLVNLFLQPEYFLPETGDFGKVQIASFLLVIISAMMGIINSHREIVKERTIIAQEQRIGVGVASYMLSKISILYIVSLTQSSIMAIFIGYQLGFPNGLPLNIVLNVMGIQVVNLQVSSASLEIFITIFLCMIVNVNIGLLISLLSKTTGQATNNLVPALAIELVTLTSIAFRTLEDIAWLDTIDKFLPTGWTYKSVGMIFNVNAISPDWHATPILEPSQSSLLSQWESLIICGLGYGILSLIILWLQKRTLEPQHIWLELDKVNILPYFDKKKNV